MKRIVLVCLVFVTGAAAARAATIADLTPDGKIQVGNALFSAFHVTTLSAIGADLIDVTGITDGTGNPGLRFSSTAISIGNGGGSRELVADAVFTIDLTDDLFLIAGIRQDFAADVSGVITAYDFTTAGPAGSLTPSGASNCVNGDLPGCPQILNPSDSRSLPFHLSSLQVDRQIQLIAARGSNGTGAVNSWDIFFSEVAAPAAPDAQAPEPSTWALLGAGLVALAIRPALRARLCRPSTSRAARV